MNSVRRASAAVRQSIRKFPGDREAHRDGLEGMVMHIGSSVRVAVDLGSEPIDIPEFGRGRMRVEDIVDAERRGPARGQGIVCVQIELSESLAVDLAERRGSVGA